jgi:PIN domain nuclease of toxin-antitoxin system
MQMVYFDREQGKDCYKAVHDGSGAFSGDRACLVLAFTRKATARTTDKIWTRPRAGIPIEILR